jgi:hypothetical protein
MDVEIRSTPSSSGGTGSPRGFVLSTPTRRLIGATPTQAVQQSIPEAAQHIGQVPQSPQEKLDELVRSWTGVEHLGALPVDSLRDFFDEGASF